ncbi:A24 family peptidase [Brevibacterium sp.]|uniref:A24 family peptidase n=1 Tax=Brevibacterium sp. TaxID=1701 RepID=UPI0028113839|nr:A24 family peptidase [Brevibacterium sp.]
MSGLGWLVVLTLVISAATGLLIARGMRWWIADADHADLLAASRWYRPGVLTITGAVLGGGVAFLYPTSAGWGIDIVLLSLILGASAAATPFLFIVDVLVHRLPDRLLYPLIGLELAVLILGGQSGDRSIWVSALVAAIAATAFFGLLYLAGRLVHARTLGLGDVKLAFVVGAATGVHSVWALAGVFVVTMIIAGSVSLIAAARAGSLRGTVIAFGPAMLSGMWLGSVVHRFLL